MTNMNESNVRYCALLDIAEECFSKENVATAAPIAQIAAFSAFRGRELFSSPRLENLLIRIGKKIPSTSSSINSRQGKKRLKILHILTHARPVGGDSRFVWRWIQRDSANQHSV